MQILAKILKEIRSKPVIQLWQQCNGKNKVEAGQSSAPRWTFPFISTNW